METFKELKLKTKKTPKARIYHGMTSNNKDKCYLFGGLDYDGNYNDLWELTLNHNDVNSSKWKQLTTVNDIQKRDSCGIVYNNEKIYIIGGRCKDLTKVLNDINVLHLDADILYWKTVKMNFSLPDMRHFTCHIYNNNIIIFGGVIKMKLSNNIYCLNPKKGTFNLMKISNKNIIKPREGHSSYIINDKLFIYGGWNNGIIIDNNIYYIDLKTMLLHTVNPDIGSRYSCVMLSCNNNLFIIGGLGPVYKNKRIREVTVFDDLKNIKNLSYNNIALKVGCSAFAGTVVGGYLIIFGGRIDGDTATNKTYYMATNEEQKSHENTTIINGNDDMLIQLLNEQERLNNIINEFKIENKLLQNKVHKLEVKLQENDGKINDDELKIENQQLKEKIKKLETNNFNINHRNGNSNELTDDQTNFKNWYTNEFSSFQKIYNNIHKNEYDYIDVFIELNDLNDNEISNDLGIKKRLRIKAFKNKVKIIEKKYKEFELYLNNINMSQYHKMFISNGIYYLDILKIKIKTPNDLIKLLNNNKHANTLFDDINDVINDDPIAIPNNSNTITTEGHNFKTQRLHN